MRILIDILHPAHVHFFKHFIRIMEGRGHAITVTARSKECSLDLLKRYGIPYEVLSNRRGGGIHLMIELLQRTHRLNRLVRDVKPDVMAGIMGPSIALVGKMQRIPAVIFYDTETAMLTNWFAYPLAHSVCTPDSYTGNVRGNHVQYPGYHELAYLHPRWFAPNRERLHAFGLERSEHYSLVRFVSWQAVHDMGAKGLSHHEKRDIVRMLENHGRVLISSEGSLPPDLESYRIQGPVEEIHHLIAFAQIFVGESATMASEAAVLGVPAIFVNTARLGAILDQEKRYHLVRWFTPDRFEEVCREINAFFGPETSREIAGEARRRLLQDKIDVTAWLIDYFESEFLA